MPNNFKAVLRKSSSLFFVISMASFKLFSSLIKGITDHGVKIEPFETMITEKVEVYLDDDDTLDYDYDD